MGKPLLFGDATFDSDRIDEIRRIDDQWDRAYIPGYAEAVRANEWAVRDGKKPIPLGHMQWIRIGHVDGREVGDRDMLEWAMQGYTFITTDELKKLGYGMPPTAFVDSQGRIRREDLALGYVDAAQRAKNIERIRAVNARAATRPAHEENAEISWESKVDDHGDIAELGARHLD